MVRETRDIADEDGAVVLMLSVEFAEPLAAGVAVAGLSEHVGANLGDGSTEQVKVTTLLNPFTEVRVTVDIAPLPACTVLGATAEAESSKSGAVKVAVTV
jgi:hypothetical protein